jgi:hypothetical protein
MPSESNLNTIAQVAMLAPAAGNGIGKVLADALTSDNDFLPLLINAAKDGLRAERSFWVKDSPGGGGHLESEPDMRIRVQTLFGLLAHMEGEPIKRIIHQHLGGPQVDPLEAMQSSPALREAARRLIEKSEYRDGTRSRKAAIARAVEATVEVD